MVFKVENYLIEASNSTNAFLKYVEFVRKTGGFYDSFNGRQMIDPFMKVKKVSKGKIKEYIKPLFDKVCDHFYATYYENEDGEYIYTLVFKEKEDEKLALVLGMECIKNVYFVGVGIIENGGSSIRIIDEDVDADSLVFEVVREAFNRGYQLFDN